MGKKKYWVWYVPTNTTAASSMLTGATTASPPVPPPRPASAPSSTISPGRREVSPFSTSARKLLPARVCSGGGLATAKSNKKCTKPFQLIYGPRKMKLRNESVVPSNSTEFPPASWPGSAVPRTYVRNILSSAFNMNDAEETTSSCTGTGRETMRRTARAQNAISRRLRGISGTVPPALSAAFTSSACVEANEIVALAFGFGFSILSIESPSELCARLLDVAFTTNFGIYNMISSRNRCSSSTDSTPMIFVCILARLKD